MATHSLLDKAQWHASIFAMAMHHQYMLLGSFRLWAKLSRQAGRCGRCGGHGRPSGHGGHGRCSKHGRCSGHGGGADALGAADVVDAVKVQDLDGVTCTSLYWGK